MRKNTTLYIVRHGETEHNKNRIVQGHCDSPLTELGISQAEEAGKELKDIEFDAIYSSDLLRAVKTAKIISLERKLNHSTSEFLRERSYGIFDGKALHEVEEKYQKLWKELEQSYGEKRYKAKIAEGMESEEEAASRYITFLRQVALSHLGKKVLIVSHGGIMKVLLIHLGYVTHQQVPPGAVQNCGMIILESDGVEFFVKETRKIIISR